LSSTRSRTSIRLEPPETRSTAMGKSPPQFFNPSSGPPHASCLGGRRTPGAGGSLLRQSGNNRSLHRQMWIVLPPVQPDLLGLIHRPRHPPDTNGKQFHFSERNADDPRDDQSFVQTPVEKVDKIRCPTNC